MEGNASDRSALGRKEGGQGAERVAENEAATRLAVRSKTPRLTAPEREFSYLPGVVEDPVQPHEVPNLDNVVLDPPLQPQGLGCLRKLRRDSNPG